MNENDITIVRREGSTCMADILADGQPIGEAIQLEDGFWYQWQEQGYHHGGATQAWVLRAIADRLDEMNKWWEEELDQQLRNP
jgi:hypothetical protein